ISFYSSPTGFNFVVANHDLLFEDPDSIAQLPPGFEGASYARSGAELDFINDVVEAIIGTRQRDHFEIAVGGGTIFGRGGADCFSLSNNGDASCTIYGDAGDDLF